MDELEQSVARGKRIAEIRREAKLKKQDFAHQVGISPAWVSYIESGVKNGEPVKVSDALILMIAHKFSVPYTWIKSGTGSRGSTKRQQLLAKVHNLPEAKIDLVLKFLSTFDE